VIGEPGSVAQKRATGPFRRVILKRGIGSEKETAMRIKRLFGLWAFGIVFALFGIAFLYLFGQGTTLICAHVESNRIDCTKQVTWMGRPIKETQHIGQLRGAYVQDNCDEDGCTYRVELRTADGTVPLTSVYSSGLEKKRSTADRINAFVDSREGTLTLQESASWIAILVSGAFLIVGLAVIILGTLGAARRR
jgi:hypothetical protein